MRARYREIEKTPTELLSLNWGMERTTILDTFPGTIKSVSNVSKKLNSTYFPTLHTKQSHVILELVSGVAISTNVIKNDRSYFK